jgi:acetyl esterase/lipase
MHKFVFLFMLASACYSYGMKDTKPDAVLTYKSIGDIQLQLHVFYPTGHSTEDHRPVMIFFFGGGWKGGTPSQFYPHSAYLASRGMVAISAEYRVSSTHGTTPQECVKDGKSAIRWVRSHAHELGIDPDQILAGGGSAGGHVAAATATVHGFVEETDDMDVSCRPAALVLFNPVFDNSQDGYGYERVQDYWEAFSPMHNLSASTPPTVVLLGTDDRLVPVETAEKYKRMMEAYGRRCDLFLYEGQKHGFFNYANTESYNLTVEAMDQFLVSLGYLVPTSDA